MWQNLFVSAVRDHFERSKVKNPRFSLRAFAKKIDIQSSALSEILSFKRNVSRPHAAKIIRALDISEAERAPLLRLILDEPAPRELPLEEARKEFLRDWVNAAVLHFFELDDEEISVDRLAARLKVPADKIEHALQLLQRMDYIRHVRGAWELVVDRHLKTSDGVPSSVIQAMHFGGLELARRALTELPVAERDFTSLIFPGNPAQLAMARTCVRENYENIVSVMAKTPKTEVFRMSVQIFPLTSVAKPGRE